MWTINFGETFLCFNRSLSSFNTVTKNFVYSKSFENKLSRWERQCGTFKKSVQKLHQSSDFLPKVSSLGMTKYFSESSRVWILIDIDDQSWWINTYNLSSADVPQGRPEYSEILFTPPTSTKRFSTLDLRVIVKCIFFLGINIKMFFETVICLI